MHGIYPPWVWVLMYEYTNDALIECNLEVIDQASARNYIAFTIIDSLVAVLMWLAHTP